MALNGVIMGLSPTDVEGVELRGPWLLLVLQKDPLQFPSGDQYLTACTKAAAEHQTADIAFAWTDQRKLGCCVT